MTFRSRRAFIRQMILMVAGMPLARTLQAEAAETKTPVSLPPPSGQSPISYLNPVAMALGYRPEVKDIDYKQFPQRARPEAKNQFCHTCANYTAANPGWGKCVILDGLVSSQGWCGSWMK